MSTTPRPRVSSRTLREGAAPPAIPPTPPTTAVASGGESGFGKQATLDLIEEARKFSGGGAPADLNALAQKLGEVYTEETLGEALRARGWRSEVVSDIQAGTVYSRTTVYDEATGDKVAYMVRSFESKRYPNEFVVEHELFTVGEAYQGQGLASAFKDKADDWYRAHGIERINVHANIDVGGYTWAKQGYDWAPSQGSDGVVGILKAIRRHATDPADTKQVNAWIKEVTLNDMEDWPTPNQLSQLGYTPGATEWAGKKGMLNSDWFGTKKL